MNMPNVPETIEYFEPTVRRSTRPLLVPPVGALRGARIAFVNNGWTCFAKMGVHIERALIERYGVAQMPTYPIPPSAAPPAGVLEQIASECDAAIVGLAN